VRHEEQFHHAMIDLCKRSDKELGYRPTYLIRAITELGGLGAARSLLAKATASEGFGKLWEAQRPDLTVERLVLDEAWAGLFTAEELHVARERLTAHGWTDSELAPVAAAAEPEIALVGGTIRERLLQEIEQTTGPFCDDCLTKRLRIKHRQLAYRRCVALAADGFIRREKGRCADCDGAKLVNVLQSVGRANATRPEQADGRSPKERLRWTAMRAEQALCDDCLRGLVGMKSLHYAHELAMELAETGATVRELGECGSCGRRRLVNARPEEFPSPRAEAPVGRSVRPWYWEGYVQDRIVTFLASQGYQIRRKADTALRERGTDIVAVGPGGRTLWVSVKGYPEKSSARVQARQWLAEALLELLLYRDEAPEVALAIGLPAGFVTYRGLVERILWARASLPFKLFWVGEDGQVWEE
jgi:hypothetical protein